MNRKLFLFGFAGLAIASMAAAASSPATAAVGDKVQLSTAKGAKTYVVVERYTGTVTTTVDMPGTDTASGVFWTGTQNITDISFEEGAIEYNGKKIDFHGLEKEFIGPHYSGSMVLGVGSDHRAEARTTVNGAGDSAVSGPVEASGTLTYTGVTVDSGLDKSNVALTIGSTSTLTSFTDEWRSSVVSGLNGASVASACRVTPMSADAATGVIERSFSGSIMAEDTGGVSVAATGAGNGRHTLSGALLLAFGLLGLGLVYTRK